MIHLLRASLGEVGAEALLHAIGSDGASITPRDRALERQAGPAVVSRLREQGELLPGTALLTPGGDTGAPFLIHVVLQSRDESVTPEGLRRALRNALGRARDFGIDSLALPPLGSGPGKLELEDCAAILVDVLSRHLSEGEPPRRITVAAESEYEEGVLRAAGIGAERSPGAVGGSGTA